MESGSDDDDDMSVDEDSDSDDITRKLAKKKPAAKKVKDALFRVKWWRIVLGSSLCWHRWRLCTQLNV